MITPSFAPALLRICCGFVLAAALAGCQAPGANKTASRKSGSPAAAPAPALRPLDGGVGWVVSVNDRLRFAVLDYSLNVMPPLGERLRVYRAGERVGEVKLSGPVREPHVVADILSGELQAGDEVRKE